MASRPTYFAFYPQDFAADVLVESMTTLQVGAYILLLCKAWQADPPASLPNDDAVLARLARMEAVVWTEVKAGVLAPFTLGTDNRWHQKRLRREYEEAVKAMKSSSDRGRKAAAARWQKRARDDAPAMLVHSASNTSASESGSGSFPMNGDRGAGEGENHSGDFELTPEGLAQRWTFAYRGSAAAHRDAYKVAAEFREWITKLGVEPARIASELARKDRDRSEATWELKKRLCGSTGQKRAGETVAEMIARKRRDKRS